MSVLRQYIKERSPKLDQLLSDLDPSNSLFNTKKLKHGFTFLFPNPEYIDNICESALDDENDAIDKLGCLIITDYLPSPSDWNTQRNDIPNLHNKKVDVINIAGRQVMLSNDVVIKLDTRFDRENTNIAVYNVVEGIVAKGTLSSGKGRTSKRESNASGNVDARRAVYKLALESDNIYMNCLNYVASFLQFLSVKHKSILDAIVPHLDYCPITSFILLFEPGKGNKYFIDTEVIDTWFSSMVLHKNSKTLLQRILTGTKDACVAYSNSATVNTAIQDIRDELLDQRMPAVLISSLNDAYVAMTKYNTINGEKHILPNVAFQYMKTRCTPDYNLKLVQDEMRSLISSFMEDDSERIALQEAYKALRLLPRLNDVNVAASQNNSAFVSTTACFINTTYFLYIAPVKTGAYGGVKGSYSSSNPMADVHVDPVALKMERLIKTANTAINYSDLSESIQYLIDSGEPIPKTLLDSFKSIIDKDAE